MSEAEENDQKLVDSREPIWGHEFDVNPRERHSQTLTSAESY